MNISRYKTLMELQTLEALRHTRLRGHGQPEIYRDADLRVVTVDPDYLVPTQRYVLTPSVEKIYEVADATRRKCPSLDAFALCGAFIFWPEGSEQDEGIPFLPPIVEASVERDGKTVWLINDGMHRVYAARKRRVTINVILVQGVPREYPYYAYPLSGGWEEVEEIRELQEGYSRKEYREPSDYKALFRDFNAVFPGIQKVRR